MITNGICRAFRPGTMDDRLLAESITMCRGSVKIEVGIEGV